MSNEYKVVVQETPTSKKVYQSNLTYNEMLRIWKEKHNGYSFKSFSKDSNGCWNIEVIYEQGEITRFKDEVKKHKAETKPVISQEEFMNVFNQIMNAVPSRTSNIGSFITDLMRGEDVTKPALTVIK